MGRSILAVFAGMVLWAGLWLGGNAGVRAALPDTFDAQGLTRSSGVLLLILVLGVLCSISAGYLTAVIARRRAVAHTAALGVVQLAIGILVQSAVWDQLPLWYHLCFLALLIPGNIIGGVNGASAGGGPAGANAVAPA